MARITWKSLGRFGVELMADAASPFSDEEQEQIRELYREHHLLLLRDQKLDRAAQMRFVGLFGEVIQNDPSGFISNVRRDVVGQNELVWHSDLIFTPEAHLGLSLYAVVADPGVAPTRFVDAEAVLDELDPSLRVRLEGLRAVHISGGSGGSARNRSDSLEADWPRHERPLVEQNPQTGRSFLAVTFNQTSHIVGLPQPDSDAILDQLMTALYHSSRVLEHHWRTGDILVWDNFALQHSRDRLAGSGRRDLERVIFGGRTIFEQHPEWVTKLRKQLADRDQEVM